MTDRRIEQLLAANRSTVADFDRVARAIPTDVWLRPIAPRKWSPAQHVEHVARAYEAAVLDLEHNRPMRLIGTPMQRRFWRLVGLSAVRWLGRLPSGAPAPREIRPAADQCGTQADLLQQLDEHVRAFEEIIRGHVTKHSRRRFTHPYFGGLGLRDGVRLAAVHTRHHARALASMASTANL